MKKCLFLILLTGCSTTVKQIRGPSGNMGHSITCKNGIENCQEKAAELCPNGYNVASESQGQRGAIPINGQWVPVVRANMFIECK